MLAADLWALNANAIWAAYWIFALHLRDRPEGLSLLIAEVDASRMAYVAANPSSKPITEDPEAMHAWLSGASASMPLLNSAIQETLRIASSSASVRSVTRDTVLSEHHLKRGERIVCYSRAIHLDDEIHEAPDQYEPARFVDTSKVRTKDGKRVTNHSLPFGGGVSMCEGRYVPLSRPDSHICNDADPLSAGISRRPSFGHT
jgi:cytochrome P450